VGYDPEYHRLYRIKNKGRLQEYDKEYGKKYRAEHREAEAQRLKRWRDDNREKFKESSRVYCIKNKEARKSTAYAWKERNRERTKETNNRINKRHCAELRDYVVIGYLNKTLNIKNPPHELIQLKREQLKMKRTLRQFKKWRKEHEHANNQNV